MKKKILTPQIRKAEDVEKTRTIEFVASDATRDSYGTVLNPKGWNLERFNKNGIIGYQHNVYGDNLCLAPDPDDVIGKGVARVEGDELIVSVTFEPADVNPKAEKIFKKLLFGSIRAVSVGFLPLGEGKFGEGEEQEGGVRQTYYYEGQELCEVSVVNIPANANAVRRSLRDNTYAAILFISRALGGGVSLSEIGKMTVDEVLSRIAKHEEGKKDEEEVDEEKKKAEDEEKDEDQDEGQEEDGSEEEDSTTDEDGDEEQTDETGEEEQDDEDEKKKDEDRLLLMARAKLLL
nr:MAG TPA: prohead serine protease [Caudoviricetes sp.]